MNEQNGQVDIERLKKLDADYWHTRPGAEVKREIDALLAHLERLEGVVEKLPETADGVPVAPWMTLWNWDGKEVVVETVYRDGLGIIHVGNPPGGGDDLWDEYAKECYSTKEAHAAAHPSTPPAASSEEGGEPCSE